MDNDISKVRCVRERLLHIVETALDCPETANTCELGEVVDMVKDLAETERALCMMRASTLRVSDEPPQAESPVGYSNVDAERMARAYDDYRTAKRHYTKTKMPEDRRKMEDKAETHVLRAMESIKDVWRDADVTQRKKIKDELTELVEGM